MSELNKNLTPELGKKMQDWIYCLTKESARTSYKDFLDDLGINDEEYKQIKAMLMESFCIKPYV